MVGAEDEAIEVSDDLRNVAGSTENPALNSFALLAYGYARHNVRSRWRVRSRTGRG